MNDEFSKAKSFALNALNKKMYTRFELYQKLLKKEFTNDIINLALDYLEEIKLLDDFDYANRYINDCIYIKKRGIIRIKRELIKKGLDRGIIESIIEDLDIKTDDILTQLLLQKSKRMDLKDPKMRNRAVGFLLRRGFTYSEINIAIRELKDENKYEDENEYEGDF